jgi:peroxiredoxin
VKRNIAVLAVVIAAIAIMLFMGRRLARRPGSLAGGVGALHGQTAPDFELTSLEGKKVHLSDYRGKAVLLNFWATWCEPCKIEMPWFVQLEKQYGPEGLQVVGVAMDDTSEQEIARFAKDMGVNYPVLLGKESVGDAYGGVIHLPTTFYIDRSGKIVDRVEGLHSRHDIEESVKEALAQGKVQAAKQ